MAGGAFWDALEPVLAAGVTVTRNGVGVLLRVEEQIGLFRRRLNSRLLSPEVRPQLLITAGGLKGGRVSWYFLRGFEVAATAVSVHEALLVTFQWHELCTRDFDLAGARRIRNLNAVSEARLLAGEAGITVELANPVRLIVEDMTVLVAEAHLPVVLIFVLHR